MVDFLLTRDFPNMDNGKQTPKKTKSGVQLLAKKASLVSAISISEEFQTFHFDKPKLHSFN